ncbi:MULTISPECIES: hypothetical protein [Streptomyces]|uniref:DNA primase/polymerase bifunctional N-terminal domain-containing protein n=1 Tax=Streptomyces luteosporeus TaxID=173856 RepID=A0ABN3TZY6_9ACTN
MGLRGGFINPYTAHEEARAAARFHGRPVMSIPGVVRVRCGVHWDAIRVGPALGQRAREALGPEVGPVLATTYAAHWTFIIDRGSADEWDLLGRDVRLLRRGTVIELPLTIGCTRTRDVRWVVPPRLGDWTDPDQLCKVLGGRRPLPPARKPPARKKSSKVITKRAAGTPSS